MKQGNQAGVKSSRVQMWKACVCHAAALVRLQAQVLLALSEMMLACTWLLQSMQICVGKTSLVLLSSPE